MIWIRWSVAVAVLGTLAAAAACAKEEDPEPLNSAAPVIGGAAATGAQYNAIGSLAQPNGFGGAWSFCTGTLIAPNQVLTAKHCALENPGDPNSRTKLDTGAVYFQIGPDARRPLKRIRAVAVKPSPIFGGGYTGLGSDVAVYTLSQPITDVAPLPVSAAPPAAADVNTQFLIVGYGVQDAHGDSQTRKVGKLTLRAVDGPPAHMAFSSLQDFQQATEDVDPHPLTDAQVAALPFRYDAPLLRDFEVYTGNAQGDDQVCNGDSGGPLLRVQDGKATIVGVASTTMTKRGYLCTHGGIHAVFGAHTRKFIAGFTGESCELDGNGALACAASSTGSDHPHAACGIITPPDAGIDPSSLSPYAQCLASQCCAETTACFGDTDCRALRGCLTACAAPSGDAGTPSADAVSACAGNCYRSHQADIGRYFGFTTCAHDCSVAVSDAGAN